MQLHKCLATLWLALARLVVMLFGLAVLIFLSPFQGLAISDRLVNASCDVAKQLAKGCTLLIVCICLIFKLVVIDCWPAGRVKNASTIFGWVLTKTISIHECVYIVLHTYLVLTLEGQKMPRKLQSHKLS